MLSSLDQFIIRFAGLKTTLTLLAIFLVFHFAIFPMFMPEDEALKPLDLQVAYTPQQAYDLIGKYSLEERANYIRAEYSADLVYPVVYTLLFSFALFLIYGKVKLARLPFLILIADYLENIGVYNLLKAYPEELDKLVYLTSFITTIKWMIALIVVLMVVLGLLHSLKKMVF